MSDSGKWFKVRCSSLSDPHLSELAIADFGRWVKFGVYMKAHGNKGQITLFHPSMSLCLAMQADSFNEVMSMIKKIPCCKTKDVDLGGVIVTWVGWNKDQGDGKRTPEECNYLMFFEKLWEAYPSNDGKKGALRHFASSVLSDKDCTDIERALNNYNAHLKTETWKRPKSGSTWFNNWRDWVFVPQKAQHRHEKEF